MEWKLLWSTIDMAMILDISHQRRYVSTSCVSTPLITSTMPIAKNVPKQPHPLR